MALILVVCLLELSVLGSQEVLAETSQLGNWPNVGDIQEAEVVEKRGKEDGMLEALLDREADRCYGRRCGHSEECCQGAACVHIEGVSGTCLPVHNKQSYQACERDSDCGAGLSCTESGNFLPSRTCQLEGGSIGKRGGFNEECASSSECDTDRGLCCQVLRRHRMASRKVCHYFLDPKSCVGRLHTDIADFKFPGDNHPFFKARLG